MISQLPGRFYRASFCPWKNLALAGVTFIGITNIRPVICRFRVGGRFRSPKSWTPIVTNFTVMQKHCNKDHTNAKFLRKLLHTCFKETAIGTDISRLPTDDENSSVGVAVSNFTVSNVESPIRLTELQSLPVSSFTMAVFAHMRKLRELAKSSRQIVHELPHQRILQPRGAGSPGRREQQSKHALLLLGAGRHLWREMKKKDIPRLFQCYDTS